MIDSITAVILAGGKSSRMGQNKALLPIEGKTLIERIGEILSAIFSKIVLSTASQNAFPQLQLPEVVDRYPQTGPLGGITSVLESGLSEIFCVGCDMPFLNQNLIEYQCSISHCCDAIIPVWNNHPQVLHGLYRKNLLPAFHNGLNEEQYKITDWLEEAEVCYLLEDEIRRYDPAGLSFRNINTPDDYKSLQHHI
ncbi:molybdenum cofactor guanylyltransferase [bacterium]|nr:molybdenum cofactor guanylyltransferase [bacterium]MCI0612791.1 molybdenum cofactor guanylyltransferase [bacterium]